MDEETDMNAISNGFKALTCGLGAIVITLIMSWSFVESTAAAPQIGTSAVQMAKTAKGHVWFGQSRPAVLVD